MNILNLKDMPEDPVEALAWLSGVHARVTQELDEQYERLYFDARLEGRFPAAVQAGGHSRKQALAWTRRANEKRGRSVRWGDQRDRTSTAYDPRAWTN